MNGEEIQLIPLRDAHTDGDTAVRFVAADVLMTGDVFRSVGYPNIDRNNGGTLKGMLASLTLLTESAGPNTTVVPGHGDITNRAAIVAHRDMADDGPRPRAKLLSEGQTIEQVVAAKPTADFDERVGNAAQSADRFVQQVYAELRAVVDGGRRVRCADPPYVRQKVHNARRALQRRRPVPRSGPGVTDCRSAPAEWDPPARIRRPRRRSTAPLRGSG